MYRGGTYDEEDSADHGGRPGRTVLAQEQEGHAQAVPLADGRRAVHDPTDGGPDRAPGGDGGHLHRHQPGLRGAGAQPAPGAAGAEHPVRAGGEEHGALHRAGGRPYGGTVRGRGDDGAAVGPPDQVHVAVREHAVRRVPPRGAREGPGDGGDRAGLPGDGVRLRQVPAGRGAGPGVRGGEVRGEAGPGDGEGLPSLGAVPVEQRDVRLEGVHDPGAAPRAPAGDL